MDLRGWIGQQHFVAHLILETEIMAKVDDGLMRARPPAGGNSVAWLIWHAARCEDLAVNAIVRGEQQVLATGDWQKRLAVSGQEIGTGMSDEDVESLTKGVDLEALRAYGKAVKDSTAAWIRGLDPAVLDAVPDLAARLETAGKLWPESGEWVRDMWKPWPASLFLNWVAIGHTLMHAGEMRMVMSQLGIEAR